MSNQASLGDISNSENGEKNLEDKKENYESKQIKNLVAIQNGYAFKKKNYAENSDVFLFRATNFTEDGVIDLSEKAYLPEDYYEEFEDYQLEENDIIINMVGANTGKMCLIDSEVIPALLNQNMWKLKPKDGINQHFFYYRLKKGVREILRTKQGSTRGFLTKYTFKNLSLDSIPSKIDEQRRIASVLYNVDQAIQKTEEIIEQTQRVKKGLMQDLFTEGYYSHEEFEEVRIGPFTYRKPESWDIKTIEESKDGENGLRRGPFGGMLKKEIFVDSGYKVYQQQNVIYEDFDYGDYYITEEKFEDMERFSVEAEDLLISCSGTLGKVARVPEDYEEGVINQALLKFSVDEDLFSTAYMKYFLESKIGQRQLVLSSRGSAMKNMAPMEFVRSSEIFHPDKEEQEKIADTLLNVDKRIQAEEKKKEQLQRLKKGLMQDLLTGEVRTGEDVRVLDEVVEVEG